MKNLSRILVGIFCLLLLHSASNAQDDSPVYALTKINEAIGGFNAKYIAYQSAVAHGSKVRKCEKKRQEMMDQLDKARYALAEIPYYKGDKSLHQSTTAYLKLVTDVMNENYQKIVNLEDIAEQSYDDMEAYILLKKQVDEKMEEAGKQNHDKVVEYCAKYNINLVDKDDSEDGKKLVKIGEVMDYYNEIYLVFFKCSVQESHFMDALKQKNVTAMEQARSAMEKYADEGLQKLDTMRNYKSDATMKTGCRQALTYFKKEATKANDLTDYLVKEEGFNKVKKNFERNSAAQNDKAEIDKYNAAVKELNVALDTYNKTNQLLNNGRTEAYKNWNDATTAFMDRQIPYAK